MEKCRSARSREEERNTNYSSEKALLGVWDSWDSGRSWLVPRWESSSGDITSQHGQHYRVLKGEIPFKNLERRFIRSRSPRHNVDDQSLKGKKLQRVPQTKEFSDFSGGWQEVQYHVICMARIQELGRTQNLSWNCKGEDLGFLVPHFPSPKSVCSNLPSRSLFVSTDP